MGVGVGVGARGGEGVRVASSSHSSGESSVSVLVMMTAVTIHDKGMIGSVAVPGMLRWSWFDCDLWHVKSGKLKGRFGRML